MKFFLKIHPINPYTKVTFAFILPLMTGMHPSGSHELDRITPICNLFVIEPPLRPFFIFFAFLLAPNRTISKREDAENVGDLKGCSLILQTRGAPVEYSINLGHNGKLPKI